MPKATPKPKNSPIFSLFFLLGSNINKKNINWFIKVMDYIKHHSIVLLLVIGINIFIYLVSKLDSKNF